MSANPNILVIDGYKKTSREELVAGGASMAADLYRDMILKIHPDAQIDVLFASDRDASVPTGVALADYDGIAWTGCSLTIFEDIPPVRAQLAVAREAFAAGVPSFGSCWAAQIAVVAAGGLVAPHPKGREMGVARKIRLTGDGCGHPMYAGKPRAFDAFISHVDEITHLPPGGVVLAGNAYTRVQSVSVVHGQGTFWGLQYHPEYDLHEIARLTHCRIDLLVKGGFFLNREKALEYVDLLETLFQDPARKDIAWLLGLDSDVMDEAARVVEVRNWIDRLVLPTMARRR